MPEQGESGNRSGVENQFDIESEKPGLNVEALVRACESVLSEDSVEGLGEVWEQLQLTQIEDGTSVDEQLGAVYGQLYAEGMSDDQITELFKRFNVFE